MKGFRTGLFKAFTMLVASMVMGVGFGIGFWLVVSAHVTLNVVLP